MNPGLLRLPQMTTTERDALGTPENGWGIYNTTLKSPEFVIDGAWLTINKPKQVSGPNPLSYSMNAGTLYEYTLALGKPGYSGGVYTAIGPLGGSGMGAIGKQGYSGQFAGRGANSYLSGSQITNYSDMTSALFSSTQASVNIFDGSSKVYLKRAYLSSDGASAVFGFYNTHTGAITMTAYLDVTVW